MELWVVYNKTTGWLHLVKGRRYAARIASTANKLNKLLCNSEITICDLACKFFRDHHIDKNKIVFGWDASAIERMEILKQLFKFKETYGC